MPTAIMTKGIPKGFTFPITRRELRKLIVSTDAHFTSVRMGAISMSESFKSRGLSFLTDRHVGILAAERATDGWTFTLEINALRDEDIAKSRVSVAACLLEEIKKWVGKKRGLPITGC